MQTEGSNKKGS